MRYLKKNEYVELSEDALYNYFVELCTDSKNKDYCDLLMNKDLKNIPVYYPLQLAKNMSSSNKAFMPEKLCSSDKTRCNNKLDDLLRSNMLMFNLKEISMANDIDGIKDLLTTSKRPLLLSLPAITARYEIPCSDDRVSQTEVCTKKMIPCGTSYCGYIDSSTFTSNGNFFAPQEPAIPVLSDTLNFVLVGFSDDYVTRLGANYYLSQKASTGAFIVRGIFGSDIGNSIAYFEGRVDEYNESLKCPNYYAPQAWKPLDDSLNTELKCVNSEYCNEGSAYYLEEAPTIQKEALTEEDEYGISITHMFEKKKNTLNSVKIDNIQFWELNEAFNPTVGYLSSKICGYWAIPYDYIELSKSLSGNGGNGVMAIDLPVKWSKGSFPDGSSEHKYTLNSKTTIDEEGPRYHK